MLMYHAQTTESIIVHPSPDCSRAIVVFPYENIVDVAVPHGGQSAALLFNSYKLGNVPYHCCVCSTFEIAPKSTRFTALFYQVGSANTYDRTISLRSGTIHYNLTIVEIEVSGLVILYRMVVLGVSVSEYLHLVYGWFCTQDWSAPRRTVYDTGFIV